MESKSLSKQELFTCAHDLANHCDSQSGRKCLVLSRHEIMKIVGRSVLSQDNAVEIAQFAGVRIRPVPDSDWGELTEKRIEVLEAKGQSTDTIVQRVNELGEAYNELIDTQLRPLADKVRELSTRQEATDQEIADLQLPIGKVSST